MPQKNTPPRRARVFAAAFGAAVGLSFAGFNLLSPWLSLDNHENRLLTGLPEVLASPPRELLQNLDTFLVDNSPFRYQCALFAAETEYRLFGTVSSDQVLAGRDGWLFYRAGPDPARPLADYQGLPDRNDSDAALAAAAASLQRLHETLAAHGCTLVLDLTPAKERLYHEYIPAGYPIVDEQNRADRLAAYLAAHTDVPVNWSYAAQRARIEAGGGPALYYKTDTHWTDAGALLSLDGILAKLGLNVPAFERYDFEPGWPHTGDLANVAALYRALPDEPELTAVNYAELVSADPRTVGVIGDSFSEYYMPYLEQRFAGSWRQALDDAVLTPALAADPGCDILILEATERTIDTLLAQLAAF